jgi:hypothetical protein
VTEKQSRSSGGIQKTGSDCSGGSLSGGSLPSSSPDSSSPAQSPKSVPGRRPSDKSVENDADGGEDADEDADADGEHGEQITAADSEHGAADSEKTTKQMCVQITKEKGEPAENLPGNNVISGENAKSQSKTRVNEFGMTYSKLLVTH